MLSPRINESNKYHLLSVIFLYGVARDHPFPCFSGQNETEMSDLCYAQREL